MPVVTEKVLENHGSINVYQNGLCDLPGAQEGDSFSLRDCVHYKYDAAEGRDITLRKQSLTTTSGTSGLFWKARIGFL